jgi:ribosomal protein S17E
LAASTLFRFSKAILEVIMQEYETLKRLVAEVEEDVNKAIGGNKAAGTRVRKKMQEIKSAAQDLRKKILEGREAEPGVPNT